jgi:hypothetical protein
MKRKPDFTATQNRRPRAKKTSSRPDLARMKNGEKNRCWIQDLLHLRSELQTKSEKEKITDVEKLRNNKITTDPR